MSAWRWWKDEDDPNDEGFAWVLPVLGTGLLCLAILLFRLGWYPPG